MELTKEQQLFVDNVNLKHQLILSRKREIQLLTILNKIEKDVVDKEITDNIDWLNSFGITIQNSNT
jgi:hypothetical protein